MPRSKREEEPHFLLLICHVQLISLHEYRSCLNQPRLATNLMIKPKATHANKLIDQKCTLHIFFNNGMKHPAFAHESYSHLLQEVAH